MQGQEDQKFFILGCQRTGTTMMRLILDSHPDIHCFDEWKGYSALLNEDYSNSKNAKLIGFKCPNWTSLFLKSDQHYQMLKSYPIIFMLRDVRGCVASMLKLKTGNGTYLKGIEKNWASKPTEEILKAKTQTFPEYRVAALYWKEQTSQYIEMIKRGLSVLPIHYEQFVQFPESHLKIICDFLQVPWNDMLMRHHEFYHDETPGGKAVGETALDRSVDLSSIFLWADVLSSKEEIAILEMAGPLNDYISILKSRLSPNICCTTKKITML